jgi:hypothetical protein
MWNVMPIVGYMLMVFMVETALVMEVAGSL